jgi:nucleotide-binding universal stress UspA family protein
MEKAIYNKILVPLDGSRESETALAPAGRLATSMSLPIELFHAWEMNPAPPSTEAIPGGQGASESNTESEVRAYLQRVASTIPRSVSVDFTVQEGAAADLIVEHAARDSRTLVAMSTTGMSGLKRWLVGSVAEHSRVTGRVAIRHKAKRATIYNQAAASESV